MKQNLLSVSYHIAQYTSIIADLRGEIQRLKCKIEEQGGRGQARGRQERGDIRHIQGTWESACGSPPQEALQAVPNCSGAPAVLGSSNPASGYFWAVTIVLSLLSFSCHMESPSLFQRLDVNIRWDHRETLEHVAAWDITLGAAV